MNETRASSTLRTDDRPVLSLRLPFGVAVAVFTVLGPFICWYGGANPQLLGDLTQAWGAPWAMVTVAILAATLFLVPLAWMLTSRMLDLIALALAQSGLLMVGYYFLDITAYKILGAGTATLRASGTVVAINAAGFAILFFVMAGTYILAVVAGAKLRPLRAMPHEYDGRMRALLLVVGVLAAMVIGLPMALSGTLPILADDPVQARFQMISSDAARPLYHLGTSFLPFVVGGLLIGISRHPRRILGIDGWIVGLIVVLQILTSNRLPLAITLLVTISLFSVERRWPRWALLLGFLAYLLMFTGLSGFTSILRQDRSSLEGKNVFQASMEEAFLGDNLIDLRDASWVFSCWDGEPLMGTTYLGGLVSMVPSAIFPQKKQWHLGLTAIRTVGWDPEKHFGLRITFFGESYFNFGWSGVVGLAAIMGALFGTLLRMLHLAGSKSPPCLTINLTLIVLMQMCLPLSNTGDAFTFWGMLGLLSLIWGFVRLPAGKNSTAWSLTPAPGGVR